MRERFVIEVEDVTEFEALLEVLELARYEKCGQAKVCGHGMCGMAPIYKIKK